MESDTRAWWDAVRRRALALRRRAILSYSSEWPSRCSAFRIMIKACWSSKSYSIWDSTWPVNFCSSYSICTTTTYDLPLDKSQKGNAKRNKEHDDWQMIDPLDEGYIMLQVARYRRKMDSHLDTDGWPKQGLIYFLSSVRFAYTNMPLTKETLVLFYSSSLVGQQNFISKAAAASAVLLN